MVPGGRKRRDSASVGARVPGVRRPGDGGAGELAAGWGSGHNRRRRPSNEPREQPRRAEPPLAGTGRCGRWFPLEGGTGRAEPSRRPLGACGAIPGNQEEVWLPGAWRGASRQSGALCSRGGGVEVWVQPAGAPARGRWQMASLSRSLPFCRGAGEMMSPRRTRNPFGRVLLRLSALRVSRQAAFCSQGMEVLFRAEE